MLDPRSLGEATRSEDDIRRFREMSPEARLVLFLELCDLTDSIVRDRPDADAIRAPTPRSAESEALWSRLMERHRGPNRR